MTKWPSTVPCPRSLSLSSPLRTCMPAHSLWGSSDFDKRLFELGGIRWCSTKLQTLTHSIQRSKCLSNYHSRRTILCLLYLITSALCKSGPAYLLYCFVLCAFLWGCIMMSHWACMGWSLRQKSRTKICDKSSLCNKCPIDKCLRYV
jgi:hypothetical protein